MVRTQEAITHEYVLTGKEIGMVLDCLKYTLHRVLVHDKKVVNKVFLVNTIKEIEKARESVTTQL